MSKIPDNIRLKELAIIAKLNKPFFDDFISFLKTHNYNSLYDFVVESDSSKAIEVLKNYFNRAVSEEQEIKLYDGIARPYPKDKAKWLFLGWIFRDAPSQRLEPLLKLVPGNSLNERKAKLMDQVRQYVSEIFPQQEQWNWLPIFEVMIDRLEGSRRAIKGNLFEEIVRRNLNDIFKKHQINLEVGKTQIKLSGETYDVIVKGQQGTILIPVKTRETMGGGHALLFTRDIHKAITQANQAGYRCIPVIIAESWTGDLQSLDCRESIYINKNPNLINEVEPLLAEEIEKLLPVFQTLI
ncbi:hypothetical protein [Gloeothece verrucosa]|uniref:Restriction endonuclease n=1 Tax=Gloeothece verrucosa (strain PCC 7822) TaxID=497965 RepID=E0U9R2_GLOV7|nr:hypothetical protein [Gloeothece verrucosa]ADN13863.1 conserved hypothetical protein [Gloeothece verrucosa PCC 7822]